MDHTPLAGSIRTEDELNMLSKEAWKEGALNASEMRYRRLFETAKDGILMLDAETGLIEDVNPFLTDLLGLTKSEFLRKKVWELGPFKNLVANHEKFLELQRNEYVRYEDLPLETADGRRVDVEFVSNVYLMGGTKVIQCNIRDITERKRAERSLKLSELSVNIASASTYWIARDAHILRVNRAACEQLGYSETELLALSIPDLDQGCRPEQWAAHWQQLREQKRMCFETRHRRKNGEICPVEVELNWFEFDGREYNFAFARDISKRKRAEGEQRLSEQRFRTIFEQAGIGIALVRMSDGRILESNLVLQKMLGYSMDELNRLSVAEVSQVDDYGGERKYWDNLIAGKIMRYQMEKRYCRKDGKLVWGLLTASVVRDLENQPLYLIGMVEVISERKKAEATLQASEAHYRTMLQGLEAGVIVHGADMCITAFNAKATELLGVTDAQMSARVPFDADWSRVRADGSLYPEAELPYHRAYTTRQPVRDIILGVNRPASHDIIWLLVNANPMLTEHGDIAEVIVTFMDVSAQIRAEAAVRDGARFTEDVMNSLTSQVVVLDGQGIIIAVNEAWRRFVRERDAGATDYLGRSYLAVCKESVMWEDATGAERVSSGIQAVLGGRSKEVELDYRIGGSSHNGWLRMRVAPLTGGRCGAVVSHHDISEHNRAMEALRVSKGRYETLFKQAAVGVAQADATSGRFVHVNKRFCEIVDRSRLELEQLTSADITHPQDVARDLETLVSMKAGTIRESTREKRYVRKDRSEVWVNLTVSAMWAPGETPDYVIAIAQDVTELKRLEEQYRQTQKMEAIGTLAGGIAHDFNNILTVIGGYAELAQMNPKCDAEIGRCLAAVRQAASRATDLVRQILTFSRQQPLERRPIKLQSVVQETLGLLRAAIPATIEFDTAIATDAPTVLADATQIHQILMNLGTNAWHAMRDHPGRLRIRLERCMVDLRYPGAALPRPQPGVYALLSVEDTGCGMDAATLSRIFEPFFTTKIAGEGTGLGLAVVHGIIDSHDGVINVTSRPGKGTEFHLYFPAYAGMADLAKAKNGPTTRGNGERVLFVDDEELIAGLGQESLTALGYVVEIATLPSAALALVRADPQRFAIVVTDQTMPGMTGIDLAIQLKRIRPDLPIILTTGYGIQVRPDQVAEAGICQLLLKPMTQHTLGSAVHEALTSQLHQNKC